MIVLNLGLAAGATSQFHTDKRIILAIVICVFALVMLYALGSQIFEGKKQLHQLKAQYDDRKLHPIFPRPFHLDGEGRYDGAKKMRKFGRVVREFTAAWVIALMICTFVLIKNFRTDWFYGGF